MKLSRFTKYKYPEPERYSPEVARERRLAGALQASYEDRERLGRVRTEALSRVGKKTVNLSRMIVNEPQTKVRKPDLMSGAFLARELSKFQERDFADPQKRAAYRALRARQEGLRNVQAAASDKRQHNPMGEHGFASTIYGTLAGTGAVHARGPRVGWLPNFHMPTSVIPCIQRAVRREVMFAFGLAGKGYHKKKRRTENSGVPC